MAPPGDDDHYEPQDALGNSVKSGILLGGAGLAVAALQNALSTQNHGAWGVFTRGGGTIFTFGAAAAASEFVASSAANLREKDDYINRAYGGFALGAVVGLRTGRMPRVLGYGAFAAIVSSAFYYTGNSLMGRGKDPELDNFERAERVRLNRRRPVEETLAEVGEGRSIRPPGYEERRRQRLKETYGIEINPVSADPNAV
ncbi:hypothetical protein B0H67DRAFT_598690 [Lasiosphaeris hirsuta]|uniref:NADH-ubiquinone oxidoreductase 21.3 kDa subunit n=1 Tax=Lasiosphaeris hirsuta TaxID=260670 RepID=A0AA40B0L2_9PEZI|nr:hypothetical protein B0H67DRAFT_598690 [Lasiosphaeris hirsuta]